jgi:hypothetical protein
MNRTPKFAVNYGGIKDDEFLFDILERCRIYVRDVQRHDLNIYWWSHLCKIRLIRTIKFTAIAS